MDEFTHLLKYRTCIPYSIKIYTTIIRRFHCSFSIFVFCFRFVVNFRIIFIVDVDSIPQFIVFFFLSTISIVFFLLLFFLLFAVVQVLNCFFLFIYGIYWKHGTKLKFVCNKQCLKAFQDALILTSYTNE